MAPAVAIVAALLAACGAGQGAPGTSDAPRTIEIAMTDQLRFDPDRVTVADGETIRFVVTNPTAIDHEFVIGDEHEQAEHGDEMMANGMMHDEANAIAVAPGETEELVYTFTEAGDFLMGCHVDGHYEVGMVGHIVVE